MIDVSHLVGKPFAHCGRGPDAYDCFGLVLEVLHMVGIDWDWEPAADYPEDDKGLLNNIIRAGACAGQWRKVTGGLLLPADVAIMSTGHDWQHVAPMVDDKYCLHITRTSTGAHLTRLDMLDRVGYRRKEIYRWHG